MSRRAAIHTLISLAALTGLYLLGARWLLHTDLMARLLSPGGGGLLLPAFVLLLRVGLIVLGPALLVFALFALAWPKLPRSDHRSGDGARRRRVS